MSEWEDRIKTHNVWQQMESLGPAIDQTAAREAIDPQTIGGLGVCH